MQNSTKNVLFSNKERSHVFISISSLFFFFLFLLFFFLVDIYKIKIRRKFSKKFVKTEPINKSIGLNYLYFRKPLFPKKKLYLVKQQLLIKQVESDRAGNLIK